MKLPSLTIWQKLSLVIMLMALPTTPLMYFYFESQNQQITSSEAESAGLEYIAELRNLAEALATHRDAGLAVASGEQTLRPMLEGARVHIQASIGAIDRLDAKVGANWETSARWTGVKNSWSNIETQQPGTPTESYYRHTGLITAVLQLMRAVSDKSSLTTDPMLDTYYLIDTVISALPPAIEDLSQLRGLAAAVAAKGSATPEELAQIQLLNRQIAGGFQDIDRALLSMDRYNTDAARTLSGAWKTAQQLTGDFTAVLTQGDASASRSDVLLRSIQNAGGSKAVFDKANRALNSFYTVFDSGRAKIGDLLQNRIARLERQKLIQKSVILTVLFFAAALVLSISRGIARQTGAISMLFGQISSGELNARAPVYSRDELGQIAEELNFMLDDILHLIESREEKENIQRNIVKLLNEVSGVAKGDLTRDAEVTADSTGAIADSFNYMLAELRRIIANVQSTTSAVNGSAAQLQHTATQLAIGSTAQSDALSHASSAIAEMARSIQHVSESATLAAQIAEQALWDAKGGADTVGKTIAGMNAIRGRVQETSKRIKRLGESSQEIGEIVRLIGDIADRTSILALNASIQASTAGEAGKGFAVVAEEVERLAVRAAESVKKISAIIKSVQSDTTEAVTAMEETTREVVNGSQLANEAGQRLRDIESISQQMASLIAQISEESRQQALGSDEVSRNVAGISKFTQQTAAGAKVTEEATRHLVGLSVELSASLARFKLPNQDSRQLDAQTQPAASVSNFLHSATAPEPAWEVVSQPELAHSGHFHRQTAMSTYEGA